MPEEFDVIILGAGCAGLSLAIALIKALEKTGKSCPRTLILEARSSYENDRSWCFWADAKSDFSPQHQWPQLRLIAGEKKVLMTGCARPYQMLKAENFYAQALALIGTTENITLRLGSAVTTAAQKTNRGWRVQSAAGEVCAPLLVDTRSLSKPALGGAVLWQSFYGLEIECEQAVFDANCVDLMNFLPANTKQVDFVYVLPLSETRALIEITVFGQQPLLPPALAQQLDAAVIARCGAAGFKVLRREQGILPMGLATTAPTALTSTRHDASRVQVGVMAGAARPSTGYAFRRIERWANACASALLDSSGARLVGHTPDPLIIQWMDALFLQVIKTEPQCGATLFMSMFGKVKPERLIRFLSGEAKLIDCLAVIAACPYLPFLRTLGRLVFAPSKR
jgi:lycopene beta-cyclase